jgi:glycosyltransferase involved in cell wall biosynthesis
MPKLLQINATANWGSTGKIAEQINIDAASRGWDCYMAYGRYCNNSNSVLLAVGNKFNVYNHYIENRLLDNEGLASRLPTKSLIEKIKEIQPDIVHLHNIHDHWLNYRILFKYLNSTDIPVVWTFHDFWAVTGHCAHFISVKCDKWQSKCGPCPLNKSLIDRSRRNLLLKKQLFLANNNLHIVAVSEWVGKLVKKSFFSNNDIRVIPNGINLNVFRPSQKSEIIGLFEGKFIILAVASQWKSGKGLDDYIAMSSLLNDDEIIVLVGVDENVKKSLPANIIGIARTNSQEELALLYSRADIVTSFSSAETFGLTIVEAFACGTPVIAYNNTAHATLVEENIGYLVPTGDYMAAYQAIQSIRHNGKDKYSDACLKFVAESYDERLCTEKYINLYNELLNK